MIRPKSSWPPKSHFRTTSDSIERLPILPCDRTHVTIRLCDFRSPTQSYIAQNLSRAFFLHAHIQKRHHWSSSHCFEPQWHSCWLISHSLVFISFYGHLFRTLFPVCFIHWLLPLPVPLPVPLCRYLKTLYLATKNQNSFLPHSLELIEPCALETRVRLVLTTLETLV